MKLDEAKKDSTKNLTDKERELLNSFPGLTETELECVNALFPHYVFIERCGDGWEVSSSCCHVNRRFYARLREIETSEEWELLARGHNEEGVCPYCGRTVTFKRTGRCGKFRSLDLTLPVALWRKAGETVFVQCYWVQKLYSSLSLFGKAGFAFDSAYAFAPGAAYQFYHEWGNLYAKAEEEKIGSKIKIAEPFYSGEIYSYREYNYTDIGREPAVEGSFLKYSGFFEFEGKYSSRHVSPMKFCTLFSIYPRQIEMLMKNGLQEAVRDFVIRGKKNAGAINWNETKPTLAFGLSKQELNSFLVMPKKKIDWVAEYKYCKKRGWSFDFEEVAQLSGELHGDLEAMNFYKACKKHGLTPRVLRNYLEKQTGPMCHGQGNFGLKAAFNTWTDYVSAAAEIGYDLGNPVVLLPKDFFGAHDAATGEHLRRLKLAQSLERNLQRLTVLESDWSGWMCELIRQAKEKKRCCQELLRRELKYSYTDGEYLIRVAENANEIIAEGKALEHCVGGYAQRHVEGKTTILFMHRCSEPSVPWLTIEMLSGKLRQIHGYKNEKCAGAADPMKEYRAFLDPWLLWVADGSPRDRDGKPITKKKKSKKEIKAA